MVNAGWGHAWGIFVIAQTDVTLEVLFKHFRTLLRVNDEQKRTLVFRFYDPRVLRIYLPHLHRVGTLAVLWSSARSSTRSKGFCSGR